MRTFIMLVCMYALCGCEDLGLGDKTETNYNGDTVVIQNNSSPTTVSQGSDQSDNSGKE